MSFAIPPVQLNMVRHVTVTPEPSNVENLGERAVTEFAKITKEAEAEKSAIMNVANSTTVAPEDLFMKQAMLQEYSLKTSLTATAGKLFVNGIKQVITTNG